MMGDSFSVPGPLREQAFFGLLKSDFKVWIPSRVSAAAAAPCMRAMKCLISMLRQCKYANKELRTSLELCECSVASQVSLPCVSTICNRAIATVKIPAMCNPAIATVQLIAMCEPPIRHCQKLSRSGIHTLGVAHAFYLVSASALSQ